MTGDNNALNPGKDLVGRKRGAMNMSMDLAKIKTHCKSKGITVNLYYLAILSKTLHSYFSTHSEEKVPTQITAGFPVSLRPPFKKLTDIELNNQIIAAPMKVPICDDMDMAFKKCKQALDALKNVLH